MQETGAKDASGNVRFSDIGPFLKDQINSYFKKEGMEVNLKYIDPSYTIRSLPANPRDSAFCLLLGRHAVHAGMSGRTGMVVAKWKGSSPIARSRGGFQPQVKSQRKVLGTVLSCRTAEDEIEEWSIGVMECWSKVRGQIADKACGECGLAFNLF
jgi:6-phosphofructokinase 1